ncbi:MAG TPA: trypsin-like peptidase domain-containing protein [Candidatus Saccharimonadales bacterium]|nr:trypsin-like peptidase domain-containing protein [Candidatus Saccharimonadales bacterium]
MNRPRPIRRFSLPLLALLSVTLSAGSMALGQDANTPSQRTTNVDRLEPKVAVAAGGDTNSQRKFTPPSSNLLSFQEIKAKADAGNAAAQTALGDAYSKGEGVATNLAEAVKWYRKASERGDAAGQYDLGSCYYRGQGVAQDYAEAVRWYRKAAEQGNSDAQFETAIAYYIGKGVPQDYTEAAKWFRKVAEEGDASAQYDLGIAYRDGQGVKQDYQEAVKWFRRSAEQGFLQGQYDLSWCYQTGHGVAQDYAEAVIWIRKPAEQGNMDAQSFLGWCYERRHGIPQDYAEAVKWYRKAAEQGNAAAEYNFGACYQNGQGIPQDYAEAVMWYQKAAEQGDADAQNQLGNCYHLGWGVPKDDAEARKWSLKAAEQYRKAAEQGDPDAQETLAECFDNAHEYAESVKWHRRAADQGKMLAQCNLGGCYLNGEGVTKNDIEAYKWFSIAAAQGDEVIVELRDKWAQTISREEVVEGQRLAAAFVARKESAPSNRADGQDSIVVGNVPRFTGTGFFVTDDGYLLTAFHVVQDAGRIAVRTKAGTFAATLVNADKANDVALLKVDGKFSALPVASSRGVKLGESVFTIGFPNIELQGSGPKLTKGEISSLTGMQDDPREFQISVPVQPGNSGGPLVNQNGNVVGIVEAQLADMATLQTTGSLPQNVNYAMKSSAMSVLLESLPEVSAKVSEPNSTKGRKFDDVEKEAESAVALVLVY